MADQEEENEISNDATYDNRHGANRKSKCWQTIKELENRPVAYKIKNHIENNNVEFSDIKSAVKFFNMKIHEQSAEPNIGSYKRKSRIAPQQSLDSSVLDESMVTSPGSEINKIPDLNSPNQTKIESSVKLRSSHRETQQKFVPRRNAGFVEKLNNFQSKYRQSDEIYVDIKDLSPTQEFSTTSLKEEKNEVIAEPHEIPLVTDINKSLSERFCQLSEVDKKLQKVESKDEEKDESLGKKDVIIKNLEKERDDALQQLKTTKSHLEKELASKTEPTMSSELEKENKKLKEELEEITNQLQRERTSKEDLINTISTGEIENVKKIQDERDDALQQLETTKSRLEKETATSKETHKFFSELEKDNKKLKEELEKITSQLQSKTACKDDLVDAESTDEIENVKKIQDERDDALQQLKKTKSRLDKEMENNETMRNSFLKHENTTSELQRKVNENDKLINMYKDMNEHSIYDLQVAWDENKTLQKQLELYEAIIEKLEKKYKTVNENHKKTTERFHLALAKLAEEKKTAKWNIIGQLRKRRPVKIDAEKLKMSFDEMIETIAKEMDDDVSFNSAISLIDPCTLKENDKSGVLEGTLGMLMYKERKKSFWLEYYVTIRNNNILFYPSDNYQKDNPGKVINIGQIVSVHSAFRQDVPDCEVKYVSFIFRILYKVDKGNEYYDDNNATSTKSVLLLADSKDDQKKWVQRLSKMVSDSEPDSGMSDSDACIIQEINPHYIKSAYEVWYKSEKNKLPKADSCYENITKSEENIWKKNELLRYAEIPLLPEENEVQDGRNFIMLRSNATSCESNSRNAIALDVVSSTEEETVKNLMQEESSVDKTIKRHTEGSSYVEDIIEQRIEEISNVEETIKRLKEEVSKKEDLIMHFFRQDSREGIRQNYSRHLGCSCLPGQNNKKKQKNSTIA